MYYQVANDPDFLRHRFVYPNEAEATDTLVEFLRPMLSAGKALRLTVNNTGPNELQTRLLVAELRDTSRSTRKP